MGHCRVRPPLLPATVVCGGLCVRLVSGVPLALRPVAPGVWRVPGSASSLAPLLICPCLGVGASSSLLPLPSPGCGPARAPSPLCSTHLGQMLQGEEEPGAKGHTPDVSRAQTREGRMRETGPRHHTQAQSLQMALCVSKDTWAVWSPPGTAPGRGQMGVGDGAVWGRPDSRVRGMGGECVQHGARLLTSYDYSHLGIMPLSQFISTVG